MNMRHLLGLSFLLTCLVGPASFLHGEKLSGIDPTSFDAQIRIQDDFYNAVNGTWLRETDIPADKSNYGSFTVLADLSEERIRQIIDDAASKEHPAGSDAQKVGDLYKSFMDTERADSLGISPIEQALRKVDEAEALPVAEQLAIWFGEFQEQGVGSPLGMYVSQDSKKSTEYIITLYQSGTSLPDRDYYLEDDPKYLEAREALKAYIAKLFELASLESGKAKSVAEKILALETKFAEVQWERTELRDAEKRYNKFTRADLQQLTPNFDWKAFFGAVDLKETGDLIVSAPSFFSGLDKIIQNTPIETWQMYAKFSILDGAAPYLSQEFVDAHFDFHSRALAGIPEQKPRWKRGVRLVEGAIGRNRRAPPTWKSTFRLKRRRGWRAWSPI